MRGAAPRPRPPRGRGAPRRSSATAVAVPGPESGGGGGGGSSPSGSLRTAGGRRDRCGMNGGQARLAPGLGTAEPGTEARPLTAAGGAAP